LTVQTAPSGESSHGLLIYSCKATHIALGGQLDQVLRDYRFSRLHLAAIRLIAIISR
jgi:hypothetical protein